MKSTASSSSSSSFSLQTQPTHVGNLYYLPRSPFSRSISIILNLCNCTATRLRFIPLLTPLYLAIRLLTTRRITAPILQTPTQYLHDSFIIAQYIDSKRPSHQPSLFPPHLLSEIEKFNAHADTLISYMRNKLMFLLKQDLSLAATMFLPRPLRRLPRPILGVLLAIFARKYRAESTYATRERAIDALNAIRNALSTCQNSNLRYICGNSLTYADIVVSQSIFFGDLNAQSRYAHLYADAQLQEQFPDIIAWASAVTKTHFELPATKT